MISSEVSKTKSLQYAIPIEISCFLLIALFTYASLGKLLDHPSFHSVMITMPYLRHAEPMLSWCVPLFEVITALLLCINKFRIKALVAAIILLSLFTLYLFSMEVSGEHLPCSCGGVIQYLSWTQHIFFNLFFILTAVVGLFYKVKERKMYKAVIENQPLLPT